MRAREIIFEDYTTTEVQNERLAFVTSMLTDYPGLVNKIYRHIKLDDEPEGNLNIANALDKKHGYAGDEIDHQRSAEVFEYVIQSLITSSGDYNDIENFVTTFGSHNYINIPVLLSPGKHAWEDWLNGSKDTTPDSPKGVSKQFIVDLFTNLYKPPQMKILGSTRGPGELALAVLSSKITFADIGDLIIQTGEEAFTSVEVKASMNAEGKGGRLKNSSGDFKPVNLFDVIAEFKPDNEVDPEDDSVYIYNQLLDLTNNYKGTNGWKIVSSPNNKPSKTTNIIVAGKAYDAIVPGLGKKIIIELLSAYHKADTSVMNDAINSYKDANRMNNNIKKLAYNNYVNVLADKKFDHFLFLGRASKTSTSMPATAKGYEDLITDVTLGTINWNDGLAGMSIQADFGKATPPEENT